MDYFDVLRNRKSARMYTEQQLSREELAHILEAANAAPVGSNLYRDIHLTVVQNRGILNQLSRAADKRWEDKQKIKLIIAEVPGIELGKGPSDPFYGAPTVIFVSHKKQDIQPGIEYANAACVTYSMHLAATALGLGSVFMWHALESMREIPELDNTPLLALPEGFEPLIGIAIGHPAKAPAPRDLHTDKIATNYL